MLRYTLAGLSRLYSIRFDYGLDERFPFSDQGQGDLNLSSLFGLFSFRHGENRQERLVARFKIIDCRVIFLTRSNNLQSLVTKDCARTRVSKYPKVQRFAAIFNTGNNSPIFIQTEFKFA